VVGMGQQIERPFDRTQKIPLLMGCFQFEQSHLPREAKIGGRG